jgi:hypothetical protein
MSYNGINFGIRFAPVPIDPMALREQSQMRMEMLNQTALCPLAQPSMDEMMGLQGYYNSCIGSIEQLRYGSPLPDLNGLMMQNPQMMMMFMMYQQMQMQTMMLMMLVMMGQNSTNRETIERLLSGTGTGSGTGTQVSGREGTLADASKSEINNLLESTAQKYGIPPDILKSIAWQESRWNPGAVGDGGKSHGMMQIYTNAHPDYNVAEGQSNIAYNIDYGAKLLRSLYDRYGSWDKAVEHYNGSGPMAQRYSANVMQNSSNRPWLA